MQHHDIKHTIIDSIKILVLNITALGISLSDVELLLRITSIIIAIIYTSWKFYNDYKNK